MGAGKERRFEINWLCSAFKPGTNLTLLSPFFTVRNLEERNCSWKLASPHLAAHRKLVILSSWSWNILWGCVNCRWLVKSLVNIFAWATGCAVAKIYFSVMSSLCIQLCLWLITCAFCNYFVAMFLFFLCCLFWLAFSVQLHINMACWPWDAILMRTCRREC